MIETMDQIAFERAFAPSSREFKAGGYPGVFDHQVTDAYLRDFAADERAILILAYDGDSVIGMVSGFWYCHPDKPREFFLNEIGVKESHQGRGTGKRLVHEVLQAAKEIGCVNAWVLTDHSNTPARRMYEANMRGGTATDVCYYEFEL